MRGCLGAIAMLAAVLGLSACGSSSSSSSSTGSAASAATSSAQTSSNQSTTAKARIGFEGVGIEPGADLAPAGTTQTGRVHGIACGSSEQLFYHIHAHLQVYANGQPRALPGGIGIPGSRVMHSPQGPVAVGGQCIYWLHTHTSDGVIHIESPIKRVYTLGNFFDEWHQPLNELGVGTVHGRITAFLNGRRWNQDPRAIPLLPHAVIQLNIGSPTAPLQTIAWSSTQL